MIRCVPLIEQLDRVQSPVEKSQGTAKSRERAGGWAKGKQGGEKNHLVGCGDSNFFCYLRSGIPAATMGRI